MNKGVRTRILITVGILLLSIYGIIKNPEGFGVPTSGKALAANFQRNIRLGLDLKGGTFLVMQVKVQDAIKAEADRTIESLKADLAKENISYSGMDRTDPQTVADADSVQINIHGVGLDRASDFRNMVGNKYSTWLLTPAGSTDYRMNLKPTELITLKKDTMIRTRDTLENRINGLGLAETSVQERGRSEAAYELVLSLPGVDDPGRIKALMQQTAMLEISEVKGGPFGSQEQAMAQYGGVLPLNTKLVRGASRGQEGEVWYLLSRTAVVTGRDLRDAKPARGEAGAWETNFSLNKDGARRFARFTEANIGNRLAIVLDNNVRSAPTIQSRIEDSGRITGATSDQDASDLALVLRAGSLPAGISYEEERTVGPSLGADSIREGITAGLFGLALVILAMLIYYRGAGVNAVLALILNAIILLAALGYFGAVLTLPGIAGFILTIGIAVDSNVLIFERIREELRAGKGIVAAISTGFDKAFVTIIDTHVTTVVSCAFLFMFGTGPVKGFAVTLVIGLIANVFTAVFVSRTMFDWHLNVKPNMPRLSI